jgi:hypothetical protein
MSEYEEWEKRMTLTPEERAMREAQSLAYRAKVNPILIKLRDREILTDEALDLLAEIKGGGPLARKSAERLIAQSFPVPRPPLFPPRADKE